jgi:hypothetical protein
MPKQPYVLKFEYRGVPLEARRVQEAVAKNTKWNYETMIVYFPQEPGASIDQIQIFFDTADNIWRHWPTKFSSDHKNLGGALAEARTANPEMHTYKVKVELHKYSDLSDNPTTKRILSEGANPSEAVYKLREIFDKDNTVILRGGTKRYVGRTHLSDVQGPVE